LGSQKILADGLTFFRCQTQQPLAHGLSSRLRAEKDERHFSQCRKLRHHAPFKVHHLVGVAKPLLNLQDMGNLAKSPGLGQPYSSLTSRLASSCVGEKISM
jgi:hypothetical protein